MQIIQTLITTLELSEAEIKLLEREYDEFIQFIDRGSTKNKPNFDTISELIQRLIHP